jgi:hypothetical protein
VGRWCMAWVLLSACRSVEPAPETLDGLFHTFWDGWSKADDEVVAANIELGHGFVDADAWTEPVFGTVSDLTPEQVEEFGIGLDPATASGMYSINMLPCAIDDLEPVLWAANQDELYTEVYEGYERTFTSDEQAYAAGTTDLITWTAEIQSELLGTNFTEHLIGGIHRTPASEASPRGKLLVQRTVMDGPAEFENDSKSLNQDYQIEVYWERVPGETMHLYGIWRELDLGAGLTMENTEVQRIILNNFVKWDEKTVDNCMPAGEE